MKAGVKIANYRINKMKTLRALDRLIDQHRDYEGFLVNSATLSKYVDDGYLNEQKEMCPTDREDSYGRLRK